MDFGAGEDVTYIMEQVKENGGKASLMLIGSEIKAPHHNSRFDFDEKSMLIGIDLLFNTTLALL